MSSRPGHPPVTRADPLRRGGFLVGWRLPILGSWLSSQYLVPGIRVDQSLMGVQKVAAREHVH